MYNSNTLLNLQANDLKAVLEAQQLLNNASILASQLNTTKMMAPFINQALMTPNMLYNSLNFAMNTIGQTNAVGACQTNIFQNQILPLAMLQNFYAQNMPNPHQQDAKKEGLSEDWCNSLGSINLASSASSNNKKVMQHGEPALVSKTRSNTTCSSELLTEGGDENKGPTSSSKDSNWEDILFSRVNDKSNDSKIIESNVSNQEKGIVFNIRRLNKKTNKFVLLTRHRKIITKCSHTDAEYYAKGMCKKCYHNKGERSRFATKCGHSDKYHYARGLCKGCYLSEYHNKRKDKTTLSS